jgi:hypothetical protein
MHYLHSRRVLLLSALGLPLAACVGAGGGPAGLASTGSSGASADPNSFVRLVRLGSVCSLHALRSLNLACGRREQANALETNIRSLSSATDNDPDRIRQSMTSNPADVPPPEAQIIRDRQLAARYMREAWTFGTLGTGLDTRGVNAARALVAARSPAALQIIPFAQEAVQALPTRIDTATQLISRTGTFMSDNGLQTPTVAQQRDIIRPSLGGASSSDLDTIFASLMSPTSRLA